MAKATFFRSSSPAYAPAPRARARRGSLRDRPIIARLAPPLHPRWQGAYRLEDRPYLRPRTTLPGGSRRCRARMETPDRRISERGGHDLTSRQNEVAQGDGLRGEGAPNPLVYPAVASADDAHVGPRGHLLDVALC